MLRRLDGALELIGPPAGGSWDKDSLDVRLDADMWRLPQQYAWMSKVWDEKHPGEISRPKVAIRSVRRGSAGIQIELSPTEWREVRALHEGLTSMSGQQQQDLLRGILDKGVFPTPNIASTHCLVETSDGMVVLAQRGRETPYHPLHWAASLEEGLEPEDLDAGASVLHAAAARGVNEELLYPGAVGPGDVTLRSIAVEIDILNPAAMMHVLLPVSSQEVMHCAARAADRNEFEARTLQCVPIDIDQLALLAQDRGRKWHPTARYRLALLVTAKFGEEKAAVRLGLQTEASLPGEQR